MLGNIQSAIVYTRPKPEGPEMDIDTCNQQQTALKQGEWMRSPTERMQSEAQEERSARRMRRDCDKKKT
jgi:hypothetical protein